MFSGRRGIHCWVCDKVARHLDNKNRNAIAEYLNLFTQQNSSNRVTLAGERMHHSIKRAHRIVEAYFDEICLNDQNVFGTIDGRQKLLELIPDESVRAELETKIQAIDCGDSKAVWEAVKRFIQANRNATHMQRKLKFLIEEIQMSILCPRLDIAVSKAANHLLKAPFCVHPKTGKICVPFNPTAVVKFDPTAVPKLDQLLKEVDQFDKKETEDGSEKSKFTKVNQISMMMYCYLFKFFIPLQTYRKTAMYKSIQIFEEFLRKLESSHKNGAKLETSDAKMEF